MFLKTISTEQISALELAAFGGEITVIDTPGEELDRAVRYLKRQRILGFDTETRPTFTADQPSFGTSLLQLSGGGKAFLFRIKKLGLPRSLCSILSHPGIVKVGATIHDDVRGLQKYAGFRPEVSYLRK